MADNSLKGWDISAKTYSLSYGPLAHRLDSNLFEYLGNRVEGAVVADLGCGPGIVARKFAESGARKIYAIDISEKMLAQVGDHTRIVIRQATMEVNPLDSIREEDPDASDGFDIVLFKRSLYMERPAAIRILRNAYSHLRSGSCIAIIHPEKRIGRYAFGHPPRLHLYTPYNLFNRLLSRIGVRLGIEKYTLHTREELVDLAGEVAGPEAVELIPTRQSSFNMLAIHKPKAQI